MVSQIPCLLAICLPVWTVHLLFISLSILCKKLYFHGQKICKRFKRFGQLCLHFQMEDDMHVMCSRVGQLSWGLAACTASTSNWRSSVPPGFVLNLVAVIPHLQSCAAALIMRLEYWGGRISVQDRCFPFSSNSEAVTDGLTVHLCNSQGNGSLNDRKL